MNDADEAPSQMDIFRHKPALEIKADLCSKDLWRKFHSLGTEMIITKAGRRMFPTVKVRVQNLDPETSYIIFMDILPVDDKRYRYVYHSSQWTVAGAGDPPLPRSTYIHPDSPASGQLWMAQGVISFDKLKLTNNRRPVVRGQVSLHSMHKYQPRVHILRTHDLDTPAEAQVLVALQSLKKGTVPNPDLYTFSFPETKFTTVTAYQNQQITRLKIASNPFAKGFREASKPSRNADESSRATFSMYSNNQLFCPPHGLQPDFRSYSWPPPAPINTPIKFVIPPSPTLMPFRSHNYFADFPYPPHQTNALFSGFAKPLEALDLSAALK
ncbi:T-box transcription factor TBX18-like isoform X2 [Neocloeon triangulifer]|nr:T-box transcription factor TBX18-like isoform X2 [Neocloeon triangulifer]